MDWALYVDETGNYDDVRDTVAAVGVLAPKAMPVPPLVVEYELRRRSPWVAWPHHASLCTKWLHHALALGVAMERLRAGGHESGLTDRQWAKLLQNGPASVRRAIPAVRGGEPALDDVWVLTAAVRTWSKGVNGTGGSGTLAALLGDWFDRLALLAWLGQDDDRVRTAKMAQLALQTAETVGSESGRVVLNALRSREDYKVAHQLRLTPLVRVPPVHKARFDRLVTSHEVGVAWVLGQLRARSPTPPRWYAAGEARGGSQGRGDRYLRSLRALLTRTAQSVSASDPDARISLSILDRHVTVDGRKRDMTAADIADAAQEAERSTSASLKAAAPVKFQDGLHPFLVLADHAALHTRRVLKVDGDNGGRLGLAAIEQRLEQQLRLVMRSGGAVVRTHATASGPVHPLSARWVHEQQREWEGA